MGLCFLVMLFLVFFLAFVDVGFRDLSCFLSMLDFAISLAFCKIRSHSDAKDSP